MGKTTEEKMWTFEGCKDLLRGIDKAYKTREAKTGAWNLITRQEKTFDWTITGKERRALFALLSDWEDVQNGREPVHPVAERLGEMIEDTKELVEPFNVMALAVAELKSDADNSFAEDMKKYRNGQLDVDVR